MKVGRQLPQWGAAALVISVVAGLTFGSVWVGLVALAISVTLIMLIEVFRHPDR